MLIASQDLGKKLKQLLEAGAVVLCFDYGLARIGVAIGNSLTRNARPLDIIHWKTNKEKWRAVSSLLDEWKPTFVVVGIPYHKDGNPCPMTASCLTFARQVEGRFQAKVVLVDERFSSVEAESMDSEADAIDDVAAQIILEQWFNEIKTLL